MTNLKQSNSLNAKLNPICHLLALVGAHHILLIRRIRVKINVAKTPTLNSVRFATRQSSSDSKASNSSPLNY